MAKKYIVREGFIVFLEVRNAKGETYERPYNGGEEVTLEDADAVQHQHKLEFVSEKDRANALAAERAAQVAAMAGQGADQLISNLVSALAQAQAVAAASQAPAP